MTRSDRIRMGIWISGEGQRSMNKKCGIELPNISEGSILEDILNNNEEFKVIDGKVRIKIQPNWGRIMILK